MRTWFKLRLAPSSTKMLPGRVVRTPPLLAAAQEVLDTTRVSSMLTSTSSTIKSLAEPGATLLDIFLDWIKITSNTEFAVSFAVTQLVVTE